MKRVCFCMICSVVMFGFVLSSCAPPKEQENVASATDKPVMITTEEPVQPKQTAQSTTTEPTATPYSAPEETVVPSPDGKGIVQFTVVLHLEGWEDGANEQSFNRHAAQLREYADLFEKYGGKMTLESKEIIDGCITWNDNVLLEMQQRGHAVGIHADAGGDKNATVESISGTLVEMKGKLKQLGIDASFASGVASKANWVEACEQAEINTVSCVVEYALWSLDPAMRPDGFEPYRNPGLGHGPYPFQVEDRVQPWLMDDGANWIMPDPEGKVLLIPTGLSLNGAYEELQGESVLGSEFELADLNAWRETLPLVIAASDSNMVNTFYAVWSFGSAVDMDLLEEWLQMIDEYVQAGSIRWSTIPEMAQLYRNSLN